MSKVRDHTNQSKPKDRNSTASSDCYTRQKFPGHDTPIPYRSRNAHHEELSQTLLQGMEHALPALQTVKRHYSRAIEYRTYRLANRSTCYDETVSSKISKMMKNIKSQMKAHFSDPSDSISIIDFLTTFRLACNINRIHEEAPFESFQSLLRTLLLRR